jgi:hypothetical protein
MKAKQTAINILKFTQENTKKEKWIIVGLWAIALYFVVGGASIIASTIIAPDTRYALTLLPTAILMLTSGVGLIFKKSWSLQLVSLLALLFMIFYLTLLLISPSEYVFAIIGALAARLVYFITQHKISEELYGADFTFLRRVEKVFYWTLGAGIVGFIISGLYMFIFLEGAYRGLVMVYGTELFLIIGFIIGLVKAFRLKKK